MSIRMESLAFAQPPVPKAVTTRYTPPLTLSAALGVYTGSGMVSVLKPPVPVVNHWMPSWCWALAASCTGPMPSQSSTSWPAFTVGGRW